MAYLTRGTVISRCGELITEFGGDADRLLREHGIDPVAIEDFDRYVRYEDAASVLGDAARQFDIPDFGLRLAERQGIASLGPLGVLLRNAETVGHAVVAACSFLRNVAPADTAELTRTSGSAVFSYSTILHNEFDRRQMVEKNQALVLCTFRILIGETFAPRKVTFQHRPLAPLDTYRALFGCDVEFSRDANSIHLAPADLSRAVHDRDRAALVLAEGYLARLRPGSAMAAHVRDVTRRMLLVDEASLRRVARAVGLHTRTLQRELAHEGTTFEEILDDLRRALAWELAATGMAATQITRALGYAEQSSFSRACRRWFGESPRTLIRRRRGEHSDDPLVACHPSADAPAVAK